MNNHVFIDPSPAPGLTHDEVRDLVRGLRAELDAARERSRTAHHAYAECEILRNKAEARVAELENAVNLACRCNVLIANERSAAEQRTAELVAWKESAECVMNRINLQAVGAALGVRLGADIGLAILPGIRSLQQRNAELEKELSYLRTVRDPGGCQCGDDDACKFARERDAERAHNAELVAALRKLVKVGSDAYRAHLRSSTTMHAQLVFLSEACDDAEEVLAREEAQA